jgi:hypothetical protein
MAMSMRITMINHGKRGLHLVAVLSRKELVENLTKNHQNILKQNSDPKLVGGFQYICKPGMTPTRSHLNTTILRLEPFPFPTWHATDVTVSKEGRAVVSPARAEAGETCYNWCKMCKNRCGNPNVFRIGT